MNGESVFGWLKVALLIGAAFVLYRLSKTIFDFFTVGAGYNNPAKRGVDSVVSTLTGRDETLGGWLAEKLNPATREVNKIYARPDAPASIELHSYIGDLPLDTSPGFQSNNGGAATGLILGKGKWGK